MKNIKVILFITVCLIILASYRLFTFRDPNCGKPDGPIINAVTAQNIELIRKHIKEGKSLNKLYKKGNCYGYHGGSFRIKYTTLHEAINIGNFEIVKLLVENGADIYQANYNLDGEYPKTPFKIAVFNNKVNIAIFLWERIDKEVILEEDLLFFIGSQTKTKQGQDIFKYIVDNSSKSSVNKFINRLEKIYEYGGYIIDISAINYLKNKGYEVKILK